MDFKENSLKFGSLTAFRGSHTNAISWNVRSASELYDQVRP
jgi:hypothetical protein